MHLACFKVIQYSNHVNPHMKEVFFQFMHCNTNIISHRLLKKLQSEQPTVFMLFSLSFSIFFCSFCCEKYMLFLYFPRFCKWFDRILVFQLRNIKFYASLFQYRHFCFLCHRKLRGETNFSYTTSHILCSFSLKMSL